MKLLIECDCGITDIITLNRTTNSHENGRVYEDYTSISESLENHPHFKGKAQPEGVFLTCKGCHKNHELSI